MTSLLELDMKIPIPNEVGVCPICGEALVGDVDEYELDDNGDMMVDDGGIELTCTSEPANIVDPEWEAWRLAHQTFACEAWNSLTAHVIKWINENYRFTNGHLPKTAEELRHWFV